MLCRRAIEFGFLLIPGVLGCADNVANARPSDMSQAQHESAGAQHAQGATEHAQQYDPNGAGTLECDQYLGSCWASNPTEEHKVQAEEHRRAAAAHRAAGRVLGDAEARACQGVSDADRDISPFFHREAIVEVKPLTRQVGGESAERASEEAAGATIVLLPARGVTAERLQRIVQCHIARNAALGNDVPEMPYCPLVLKGVSANVTSAGNAFAVNVSAEDQMTAAEVLRRARALTQR